MIDQRLAKWLASDDTGISSMNIMLWLSAKVKPEAWHSNSPPSDAGDLGHCLRLLALFPEWDGRIAEMAEIGGMWPTYPRRRGRQAAPLCRGDTRMNPQDEALSVTQADRDAASNWLHGAGNKPLHNKREHELLSDAFARHRLSHSTPGDAEVRSISVAEEWNVYMTEAVNNAPEPLRKLGEYLAELLDEDQWKTAERYLNGALLATPSGRAQAWLPIETAVQWDVAIVTDGESIAVSQLCETDHGEWYWSRDPEDVLWFEPTHWRPDDRPAAPPAQDQTKGVES